MVEWSTGTAVIIPCYRVRGHVLNVIAGIGPNVDAIYVVDDKCPEESGTFVHNNCADPRVRILFNPINLGVGGATLKGFAQGFADGALICVKIDGDGQMDPAEIAKLIRPIEFGDADYAKGNRFFDLRRINAMPLVRIFGNAVLSFLSKGSSGYWDVFDPTNGFVALHRTVFETMDIDKISKRFFFESDLLFRLYLSRAVVVDVPMHARYGDEASNLEISKVVWPLLKGHVINFAKRVFYIYLLRDFSIASIYLIFGFLLLGFGVIFGALSWIDLASQGIAASAGTVMLAGLPIILGFQLLLGFVAYDMQNIPRHPIQKRGLYQNWALPSAVPGGDRAERIHR